jgi:hypothetical protein
MQETAVWVLEVAKDATGSLAFEAAIVAVARVLWKLDSCERMIAK